MGGARAVSGVWSAMVGRWEASILLFLDVRAPRRRAAWRQASALNGSPGRPVPRLPPTCLRMENRRRPRRCAADHRSHQPGHIPTSVPGRPRSSRPPASASIGPVPPQRLPARNLRRPGGVRWRTQLHQHPFDHRGQQHALALAPAQATTTTTTTSTTGTTAAMAMPHVPQAAEEATWRIDAASPDQ